MEVKLWNELNDQQAEKATGGGLGNVTFTASDGSTIRLVDGLQAGKDDAKQLGFKNGNDFSRTVLGLNVGQVVSTVAKTGRPPTFPPLP